MTVLAARRLALTAVAAAVLVAARPLSAQLSVGAQAVGSVTRLTNAIDGQTRTEGYVSQPAVMGHGSLLDGHLTFTGTLNFEGLTLQRGELLGAVYGEGYVDRRHPHTLVHEAIVAVQTGGRRFGASLAGGRGFVPFGTDDPMTRPFERYPVNHHLAQILERVVAVGAVRVPHALLEGATFNGDEPSGPYAAPVWRRFGDSWAARLTLSTVTPANASGSRGALETQGSVATVRAPENPHGGGLDARKWSASARWASGAPLGGGAPSVGDGTYALVEWARTDWMRGGERVRVPGYRDGSALAEGGVRRRGVELVARAERTDRLEEERLVDPFRAVRPAPDVSTLGVTQWTVLTVGAARPLAALGTLGGPRASPFVELSSLTPRAAVRGAVFDPVAFYGARRLWALTAGVRLGVGTPHPRMGRYGVAAPAHDMHDMHGMRHTDATSETP